MACVISWISKLETRPPSGRSGGFAESDIFDQGLDQATEVTAKEMERIRGGEDKNSKPHLDLLGLDVLGPIVSTAPRLNPGPKFAVESSPDGVFQCGPCTAAAEKAKIGSTKNSHAQLLRL